MSFLAWPAAYCGLVRICSCQLLAWFLLPFPKCSQEGFRTLGGSGVEETIQVLGPQPPTSFENLKEGSPIHIELFTIQHLLRLMHGIEVGSVVGIFRNAVGFPEPAFLRYGDSLCFRVQGLKGNCLPKSWRTLLGLHRTQVTLG